MAYTVKSNIVNNAIDSFWQSIGDITSLTDKERNQLSIKLAQILNIVDASTPIEKAVYPTRGYDIDEFYFISSTRSGCPKIEKRAIGMKGITNIEVTNVGNSFNTDKHLTKVRVTGLKEDGKTKYTLFFNDVYSECSKRLLERYEEEAKKYMDSVLKLRKDVEKMADNYQKIICNNYEYIEKKIKRAKVK